MAHISFEESIKILKDNLPSCKDCEKVFLDTALNRVLAEDITAKYNTLICLQPQWTGMQLDMKISIRK